MLQVLCFIPAVSRFKFRLDGGPKVADMSVTHDRLKVTVLESRGKHLTTSRTADKSSSRCRPTWRCHRRLARSPACCGVMKPVRHVLDLSEGIVLLVFMRLRCLPTGTDFTASQGQGPILRTTRLEQTKASQSFGNFPPVA